MSISLDEAVLRFLDDLDEEVVRMRYNRIVEAFRPFLDWVRELGVTQLDDLSVDHIERFLDESAAVDGGLDRSGKNTWHAVSRFVTWCGRRKYATELSRSFSVRKPAMRRAFLKK